MLFFTASRFTLFSVMAHPSRSHNSQSVSENLFPLPVVDQVLEVYDRQPNLSPDAMELSCSGTGPVLSQTGDASKLPTLTAWSPWSAEQPSTPNALAASASPSRCSPNSLAAPVAEPTATPRRTLPLLHPRAPLRYQLLHRQLDLCGLWSGLAW